MRTGWQQGRGQAAAVHGVGWGGTGGVQHRPCGDGMVHIARSRTPGPTATPFQPYSPPNASANAPLAKLGLVNLGLECATLTLLPPSSPPCSIALGLV